MACRVLLALQHTQELGPVVLHEQSPGYFRVTRQTEGEHLQRIAISRFPVMDRHRALAALDGRASRHATTVVITLQHFLTVTAEVGLILPLQRVAGLA